jgi:rod shape-determining protein MreD
MIFVVFWFVQDFLTILTGEMLQIPEFFLLSLVYGLLKGEGDKNISIIWTAFFGGLLWDLRWMGIPGFFTLIYVGIVLIVLWVWNTLPSSGRTPFLIFTLFWATQLLPVLLFILIWEHSAGDAVWVLFGVQQGCAVPIALLSAFLYLQQEKGQNA